MTKLLELDIFMYEKEEKFIVHSSYLSLKNTTVSHVQINRHGLDLLQYDFFTRNSRFANGTFSSDAPTSSVDPEDEKTIETIEDLQI